MEHFLWQSNLFLPPCPLLLSDIDECVSGVHDCHRSASCTNTVGSYTCTCNHPLSGDGKTCRYTAAGEHFTLIVLQFKLQRLDPSWNCPPNEMPKKNLRFLGVMVFLKKQSAKTNSRMVHLSGGHRKIWTPQGTNQNLKFSFPSWISLKYWGKTYCCN